MSRRPTFLALGLLAATLLSVLALELDASGPEVDETGIVPLRHLHLPAPRAAAAAEAAAADRAEEWAATALARPLFSRDRRPTPAAAKPGGGPVLASLPRLAGVVIGPGERTAIFAGAEGHKPVAVPEGGRIGAYTLLAVDAAGVRVAGPEGERTVPLRPDAATRGELAAQMPPPQPGQAEGAAAAQGLPAGIVPGQPLTPAQRAALLNLRGGPIFARRGAPPRPAPAATQEGSD